jgi:predicted nucleic acid-binding protein
MYTLDASVWVNGFDRKEPGAITTRHLLQLLAVQGRPIIIPNLALVEVAGSVSRTRRRPAKATAFVDTIVRLPHVTVVPLTADLAEAAAQLAARHALRGADAVYAAVALAAGCTLISLDGEHLARLRNVVPTLTPAAALEFVQQNS